MLKKTLFLSLLIFFTVNGRAQITAHKYPSLLWEITGNGLKKPSYLFGTMHVSNKMVFHLSDSFYLALQSCDAVALELNPAYWQRDMMQMTAARQQIDAYLKDGSNDYLTEQSFRLTDYTDDLKAALTQEPAQINSLLYRTLPSEADYEEDTYLDLYLYQTGRKLGKQAGGVEDYYQTEKILFDAYRAMAREKNSQKQSGQNISADELVKNIEDAYKRGDLDLLDSLERVSFNSPAYLDKFLYGRDSIQAYSIDTILRHHTLFVGVGAAHLPGPKGVIELLRKKGYILRPVKMQDQDAARKEAIDRLKVPVEFREVTTDHGFVKVAVPGTLYPRGDDDKVNNNESWQYADMDNGTYYMLTSVKTHAAMLGQSPAEITKKVDSLLYENIPGKILTKTAISRNGYPGFDITNKTRRGDIQRYMILITPFEVLVFKMSGNEDYVEGPEAGTFFNSVTLISPGQEWNNFVSGGGGFSVRLPQIPHEISYLNNADNLNRWEYEAYDSASGNSYMIWKEAVQNYHFLEEDSFDLSLMEESLKQSGIIQQEISRRFGKQNGYAVLDLVFSLKSGAALYARAILRGSQYYLLAVRSPVRSFNPASFFKSFSFIPFVYPKPSLFKDSLLHFEVTTPVQPDLDPRLMNLVAEATSEDFLNDLNKTFVYWPKIRYAYFQSDATGEAVRVSVRQFPRYYYSTDTAKFWKYYLNEKQYKGMVIKSRMTLQVPGSCTGYKLVIGDTNTVRQLTTFLLLKDDRLFELSALEDTLEGDNGFSKTFMDSFRPETNNFGPSVFQPKLPEFFSDFSSPDSLVRQRAAAAIDQVKFTCAAIPEMEAAISGLTFGEPNYSDIKNKLISELGYIDDTLCGDLRVQYLAGLYTRTADTGYFQNTILQALANIGNRQAYDTLKSLLLQDPPVFDDPDDYSSLFESLADSLSLAKTLFPEIMQLGSVEDYRKPLYNLLQTLLDSGFLGASDYREYYSTLYFAAKISLKKQQLRDEKILEKQEDGDGSGYSLMNTESLSDEQTGIRQYSDLLIPFYKDYAAIPRFFDKLLASTDPAVRLNTATLLLRHHFPVPDSVLLSLAASNKYRALLYSNLETLGMTGLFPDKYRLQEAMARSVLLNNKNLDSFGDIRLVGKQWVQLKNRSGYVYYFMYKTNPGDRSWQIGLSGLQPSDLQKVSSNTDLTSMTGKTITTDRPVLEQFGESLKRMLISRHPDAAYFFEDDNDYRYLQRRYGTGN